MTRMKFETKTKLTKLADYLISKYGRDAIYLTDWELKQTAVKTKNNISYQSLQRYRNYLEKIIKTNIPAEGLEKVLTTPKVEAEVIVEETKTTPPNTIKIEINGETWTYILQQNEEPEPIEEEVWLGLFDYKSDKEIIIRRGKYAGCNVREKASVLETFKNFDWFEKWCQGRLDDVENGKIISNSDTPRDIETLNRILKSLKQLKSELI